MKRILVAVFVLSMAVAVSFVSIKSINKKLDILETKTIAVMKDNKSSKELYDFWKNSEKVFAFFLNEDKYKNLSRCIHIVSSENADNFANLCEEILFEISVIRETQEVSLENIL